MHTYIALLRGVNVGGKNTISMPQLKAALEQAGFEQVRTYINSGNLLFCSDQSDAAVIRERFSLDIAVAVLRAQELADALAHAPVWWGSDKESKHNAIFVIAPASAQSVIEQVGQSKPEYEQVAHHGRVIFWSAPLQTFSRTRWSKIVGTGAYASVTIRNANTAKKLAALAAQPLG